MSESEKQAREDYLFNSLSELMDHLEESIVKGEESDIENDIVRGIVKIENELSNLKNRGDLSETTL